MNSRCLCEVYFQLAEKFPEFHPYCLTFSIHHQDPFFSVIETRAGGNNYIKTKNEYVQEFHLFNDSFILNQPHKQEQRETSIISMPMRISTSNLAKSGNTHSSALGIFIDNLHRLMLKYSSKNLPVSYHLICYANHCSGQAYLCR